MRGLAFVLLTTVSCSTPPLTRHFDAPAPNLESAVLEALQERGEVTRDGATYETYWQTDAAARDSVRGSGLVLAAESRFRVTVADSQVEVEARSRLFVRRGTRRRDWEEVDPAPAATRLLDRIQSRLR
jgi:hypothetical protein